MRRHGVHLRRHHRGWRFCVIVLSAAISTIGPIQLTQSGLILARTATNSARTPPLVQVGLATPQSTSPQNYSITGIAPGGTADYLVNLRNDGTASVPGIGLELTTSTSTALDTDTSNGLQVQLTRCEGPWQQPGGTGNAICETSSSTIAGATALAGATSGGVLVSGLAASATAGIDHLRVRFSLPAAAPPSYSALTSHPRVTIWGTYLTPTAPLAPAVIPGDGSATISWTAPANAGFRPISSYTVTGSPGGGSCTTSGALSCGVSGLTNGLTYSFTVTATNSLGTGPASAATTGIPFPSTLTGSGNLLWLDAADSSTLFQNTAGTTPATTAGQYIGAWKDKSGAGNDVKASGALSTTAPTLDTSIFARPSLTFGDKRFLLRSTGFPTMSNYSIFAVYRSTQNSAPCTGNILSGASNHALYLKNGTGLMVFHSSSVVQTTLGFTLNTPYVGSGTFTTGSRLTTVDVNAGGLVSGTVATENASDAGIQVGAYGSNNFFCGQIAETSVFNRVLTAAERRSMQEYLGRKWSISVAPTPPTSVSATPAAGAAAVSWSVPASTGGAAVTGYTATASPGGATCSTSSLACSISGLTNGTTYSITVTATNSAGLGLPSSSASVTPVTVPGAPTGLALTRGNTHATATWTAPASNGGSAITGYTVTATPGPFTCTTSGAVTCVLTGLTNSTVYTASVSATNAVGTGAASSAATVTPAAVPGPPTALVTTPGDATGTVSWTAPADNGGSAITSYTATATATGLTTRTCSGPGTSCSLPGLTNGAPYTVTVTGTNATGAGEKSGSAELIAYPAALLATANLGAWFDAASSSLVLAAGGSAATTGQNVATLTDRGGNGLNVSQPTVANQMTVSALNGRQALLSTPATWFTSTGTGTYRTILAVAAPSATAGQVNTIAAAPANTDFSLRLPAGAMPAPSSNDWANGGLDWTNSVASYRTAPTAAGIFVAQASADVAGKTVSVGSSYLSRSLNGTLGEVILLNRVLTSAERRQLEEYLARKWGVTITPQAPAISSVTNAGAGSLTVTWTAPGWNGGSAVTGYTATAGAGGPACTTTGALSCTISGLTAGQSYAVTSTATNAAGASQGSAAVSGTA